MDNDGVSHMPTIRVPYENDDDRTIVGSLKEIYKGAGEYLKRSNVDQIKNTGIKMAKLFNPIEDIKDISTLLKAYHRDGWQIGSRTQDVGIDIVGKKGGAKAGALLGVQIGTRVGLLVGGPLGGAIFGIGGAAIGGIVGSEFGQNNIRYGIAYIKGVLE